MAVAGHRRRGIDVVERPVGAGDRQRGIAAVAARAIELEAFVVRSLGAAAAAPGGHHDGHPRRRRPIERMARFTVVPSTVTGTMLSSCAATVEAAAKNRATISREDLMPDTPARRAPARRAGEART